MNRTQSIALFAGIFAIAMTTYGLSGVSASPMIMASNPQTVDSVGILGHVDYIVYDENQQIKSYLQSDNVVVEEGKDCAGELIFGATPGNGNCDTAGQTFQYIAIGNGSQGAVVGDSELAGGQCAAGGGATLGEMARKLVVPTVDVAASGGSGAQVVLDVGTNTFTFGANASSGNTVTQSGLFNGISTGTIAAYDGAGFDGTCRTYGAVDTNWEMFAIQDLSGGGVSVSSGDSLAVKWTITLN